MPRINSITGVRGLGAILVAVFHTQTIVAAKSDFVPFFSLLSDVGRVDLFFVLSGFIICYVHAKDFGCPSTIRRYIFDRISRIYPSVWIVTALAILIYMAGFGGAGKAAKLNTSNIFTSFLLIPQFRAEYTTLVNVTWTLKLEISFYATFITFLVSQRLGLLIFAAWCTIVALAPVLAVPEAIIFLTDPHFIQFPIGMTFFWIYRRFFSGRLTPLHPTVLLIVGGGISVAAFWGYANPLLQDGLVKAAFLGTGAGFLIVGCVCGERLWNWKVPYLLDRIGTASYSVYLIHFSTISILAAIIKSTGFVPFGNSLALCLVLIGIGAGLIFDTWVDKPIQRALRNYRPALSGLPLNTAMSVARPG